MDKLRRDKITFHCVNNLTLSIFFISSFLFSLTIKLLAIIVNLHSQSMLMKLAKHQYLDGFKVWPKMLIEDEITFHGVNCSPKCVLFDKHHVNYTQSHVNYSPNLNYSQSMLRKNYTKIFFILLIIFLSESLYFFLIN